MIMFNTYMNQFTCSHHDILLRKKINAYLDAKGTYKKTCYLYGQSFQAKTLDFTRERLYEIEYYFLFNARLVIFTKTFIFNKIEKLAYHRSYYKIHGKHHLANVIYGN